MATYPLSPYLFLLCAEGFSALLKKAEDEGEIEGVKVCHGAPSISHLMFADDSLILVRANGEDAAKLQGILDLYAESSGQVINKEKSAIMFSKNTTDDCKAAVMQQLGITRESFNDKYLGLPIHVGKNRVEIFSYLKERVWQRIQGWKEKLLSNAGKEIMIKAVAQAIPTYAMGCFDIITKEVCDQISRQICRYWWSQNDKENKMHWLGWEKLKKSKKQGGLGFRDVHAFNLAMLAKQGWRLVQSPNSLCARIMKAKYFRTVHVLNATPKEGMSYTWRSILKGIELLKKGVVWRVGSGENIRIWDDPWLPYGVPRRPITPRGRNLLTRVDELISPITGKWDEELVRTVFWPDDVPKILAIPVHPEMDDVLAWHFDSKGVFSVKSAYKVFCDDQNRNSANDSAASTSRGGEESEKVWSGIWKMQAPSRLKHFIWRLAHNSLALRQNLKRRGIRLDDDRCLMCSRQSEDGGHLFIKCKQVRELWRSAGMENVRLKLEECCTAKDTVQRLLTIDDGLQLKAAFLLNNWWQERNQIREGMRRRSIEDIAMLSGRQASEIARLQKQIDGTSGRRSPKCRWQKPPQGTLKMNVDGAFRETGNHGGWGYVIRDDRGDVIQSGWGRVEYALNPLQVELIACSEGVKAASLIGVQQLILETDAQQAVWALQGDDFRLATMGGVVHEAKEIMSDNFASVIVRHVPRECNRVAHELASLGSKISGEEPMVMAGVSDCIMVLVSSDSADMVE